MWLSDWLCVGLYEWLADLGLQLMNSDWLAEYLFGDSSKGWQKVWLDKRAIESITIWLTVLDVQWLTDQLTDREIDRQKERRTVSLSDWQTYVWPTDKLIDHYFYFKIQQYARNIDELKSQLGVSQDKLHKQSQEASRRDEQLVVLKVELATLQEKHRLVQDEVLKKTSLEIPVWK